MIFCFSFFIRILIMHKSASNFGVGNGSGSDLFYSVLRPQSKLLTLDRDLCLHPDQGRIGDSNNFT